MNDFRSDNEKNGKVTPLRASFNKHPGKLNCNYKDSKVSPPVAMTGFMTQYMSGKKNKDTISNTSKILSYNHFGTLRPEKNIPCQMVSNVEELRPICEMFGIDITEQVTVSFLMVEVLKQLHTFLHKSIDEATSNLLNVNEKWVGLLKSESIQNALRNDSDWKRLVTVLNNEGDSMSSDNDFQSYKDLFKNDDQSNRDKLYTILRIMLQQHDIDNSNVSNESDLAVNNHSAYEYCDNYCPWLKLWSMFRIFNLQLNTCEDSFQSYFDELCLVACLEFSETDIPSMIAKLSPKTTSKTSKDITVTIHWSSESISTLIQTQETLCKKAHSRLLDGICR